MKLDYIWEDQRVAAAEKDIRDELAKTAVISDAFKQELLALVSTLVRRCDAVLKEERASVIWDTSKQGPRVELGGNPAPPATRVADKEGNPYAEHVCDYRCGENGHHAWPAPPRGYIGGT